MVCSTKRLDNLLLLRFNTTTHSLFFDTLKSDSATLAETGGRQVSKKPSIAFSDTKFVSAMAPSTNTADAMALVGREKKRETKGRNEKKG